MSKAEISQLIPSAFKVNNYSARALEKENDIELLQKFCEENNDWFELVSGNKAGKDEATEYFNMLPPGKTYKDKFVIGLFDNKKLIAFIDIIKDYKEADEWALGTFLISPKYRNQGLGAKLLKSLEDFVLSLKGKVIKIVVQEQNLKAISFWEKQGFVKYDKRKQDSPLNKDDFLMRKNIG